MVADSGESPDAAAVLVRIRRRWTIVAGVVVLMLPAALLLNGARRRGGTAASARGDGPPAATRAPTATEGASLWGQYCEACHGFTAQGRSPLGPVLVSREYLAWVTDERLDSLVTHGVPGTAMLGWGRRLGGVLGEREVRSLVLHLRRLQPTARSDTGWAVPGRVPRR